MFVPIVPRMVGMAELSVKAQSTLYADGVKRQLRVEAEGKKMHFNVPVLLSELNPTDVQLAFPDNIVPESQKIQVSAIGRTADLIQYDIFCSCVQTLSI